MSGRPSEKRYQLAAQKRHEESLKFDYYNQTARYFERESGKARQFNTWNVDELKSTKLDNKKKQEALKTRQNKLRELLNDENQLYDRERQQLQSRPATKEEFTIEELRKKLQEKRTEQSLYNPHTYRRIQSYFSSPKNPTNDRVILSDNSSNQLPTNPSNQSQKMADNDLNSRMSSFEIRSQQFKENREASQSSNIASFFTKSSSEMDTSRAHSNKSSIEMAKNTEDQINVEENDLEVLDPNEQPSNMNNQILFSENTSSTKPSNNLQHTAAFDTRAQEFKNNQNAGEASSINFYQNNKQNNDQHFDKNKHNDFHHTEPHDIRAHECIDVGLGIPRHQREQSEYDYKPETHHFLLGNQTIFGDGPSSKSVSEKKDNNLHYTEAFDIRAQECNDNRMIGEGSSIGRNQMDHGTNYKREKHHFLLGNQMIIGDDPAHRSVSEKKDNNLHYTKAFDIRAQECKNNQTASEASSISFINDNSYFEKKPGSRGGDKRHFYTAGDQKDTTWKPRGSQQVEIEKDHDDQSDNERLNKNCKNELDIRTREYKDNQAAGEGSNITFGNEKSQFSKEQLRRGSGSSSGGSSASSSRKSLEHNLSIGQGDGASDWQPKSKYADRYKRRSLQDTNVFDTAGSREATPPLTADEKSHYGENEDILIQENQNLTQSHFDSYDKKKSQDETDKSLNYGENNSHSMLAYVTYTKLKSEIMDLEKRESRAVTKQEWEDALRLREMKNNLELLSEKKMWEHLSDVDAQTKKQAFNTIQLRADQLAKRDKFCDNTELYSEDAKLMWKKWDREDKGLSLIATEKYRQTLLEKLEEDWQQLAAAEKTKIYGMFDKTMASSFQHEMGLLSKAHFNRH